jgi:Polysulphide reductase, NrfD
VSGANGTIEVRSYYGRPILKQPVWSGEVAWYLFVGGLTGASAPLAFASGLAGNRTLARRGWAMALAGVSVSAPLLVADLGRLERFLNMLRVFKVTSPMSVGAWTLTGLGISTGLAAAREVVGLPLPGSGAAKPVAAALGPVLATYTAALLADTAVPAWHGARRELPFVFGGSAASSAGAAMTLLTPRPAAGPARRLAVGGAAVELAAVAAMERRLGELGEPYHQGKAGRYARAARALTAAGALTIGLFGRRSRLAAAAGGAAALAGAVCQRWAVYSAGFQSTADPKYVVKPQRERIAAGASRGA